MKRCLACHQSKPDRDFPSALSLTCNFCTPTSDRLATAIMGNQYKSGDGAPPHRFGPGYDGPSIPDGHAHIRTQRATVKDDSIKKAMLDRVRGPRKIGMDEQVDISSGRERFQIVPLHDERPLIDILHEATFTNPIGLQWVKDKYQLRMTLRKAHCFTLDDETSRLVADFSLAIAHDLESVRRMVIPPFPVTWIDINNVARINRIAECGVGLTDTASRPDVCPRIGWLIHPAPNGFYATYVAAVEQGAMTAPLSYWWHTGEHGTSSLPFKLCPDKHSPDEMAAVQRVLFGVMNCNVNPEDAAVAETGWHSDVKSEPQVQMLMNEIAGELRHIWGFLLALGAGHLGAETSTTPQPKHSDIRTMSNGKPLLPLEHKILHLHLGKRTDPKKLVARAISQHKHRLHEVRGHWRTIRNPDGTVKKRVAVKDHKRGDERLGVITKTYRVER
jgi:hypothetical protein